MADIDRLTAPVTDGVLDYGNVSTTKESSGSSVDKEMFLQLLVAQMKYQDPMEPMDNSQYVSQLATFSQLEEMQNMEATIQADTANNLVGKYVIMQPTNTTGTTTQVSGYVDYTMSEGGKTYLSVNGTLYNYEDLYSVVDEQYLDGASVASTFSTLMSSLPDESSLTLDYADTLAQIRDTYDALSGYQKSFLNESDVKKLEALEERMAQLKEASGSAESDEEAAEVEETEEG